MYSMLIYAVSVVIGALYILLSLAFPGQFVYSFFGVDLVLWVFASPILMIPAMVFAYIEEKITDLVMGY